MIKSMTGFGRAEVYDCGKACTLEVRSVNHRFLDISVRVPKNSAPIESEVKRIVQKRFARGRFDVAISFGESAEGAEQGAALKVDSAAANQYVEALRHLKTYLALPGDITLELVASNKDLIRFERPEVDLDALWSMVEKALVQALNSLEEMRRKEGETLCRDITARLDAIGLQVAACEARLPQIVLEYRTRLKKRTEEALATIEIDPARLEAEVVIFTDRSDVSEEIVRLKGHIEHFKRFLILNEPTGRRLDFLIQEMHKEVNTISSKVGDLEISRLVVEVKGGLEKIREQVQNVE